MAVFDASTPDELWYPIPSLPGYQFSSDLRVRSFHVLGRGPGGRYGGLSDKWRIITVAPLQNGYLAFHVRIDGKQKTIYLHHIIAELAYGPRPAGMLVRHINDDRADNYASNLRYGTYPENWQDAERNGRSTRGSARKAAKLAESDIPEIRVMLAQGEPKASIARRFGVTCAVIHGIAKGTRWTHVPL